MDFPLPDGLALRPATHDDLETALALITAQQIADYGEALTSADDLLAVWSMHNADLEGSTWLAFDREGRAVAYAALRASGERDWMPTVVGGEGWPGLVDHLLGLAEARARRRSEGAGELFARVVGENQLWRAAIERAGYKRTITFLTMEIVLDGPPPAPNWPAGVSVRGFVSGEDDQATYEADEAASADKGYHDPLSFEDWARRMNLRGEGFDPDLWFLACDEAGAIVGVALNNYAPRSATGWVDHLGVLGGWRGRGIGQALLLHAFGVFFARGVTRIRLNVDAQSRTGAPRLYERAGMRSVQHYEIYTRPLMLTGEA